MYETMLIVDDYKLEREMFKELLQDTFTILEAENGKECLETVESCRGHIDVILLDLMMPELDGFQVLERRKELDYFADIPVVVLTSSGAVEDQVKAFELGANDFISKPIIPDIAISRVNNVLESRRRIMSIMKESEEFKVKSEIDMMTELYNKVTAEQKIDSALQTRSEELQALMIIDIDNFKSVNDLEGHQVGDHTIRIIADLISTHFRRSDIVGRIGGDEFIVLMTGLPSKEIARQKARDIVRIMKYKPNLTIPANVSVSIGLVFNDKEITDYHKMFEKADKALYQSKKEGKARLTEYGYVPTESKKDNRNVVVLCSRIRNICSTVESVLSNELRFLDVVDLDELSGIMPELRNRISMIFIDVSDEADAGRKIWLEMKEIDTIKNIPTVAICQEGNLEQYRETIMNGIAQDVVTTPLDVGQLKRRITAWLTQ